MVRQRFSLQQCKEIFDSVLRPLARRTVATVVAAITTMRTTAVCLTGTTTARTTRTTTSVFVFAAPALLFITGAGNVIIVITVKYFSEPAFSC